MKNKKKLLCLHAVEAVADKKGAYFDECCRSVGFHWSSHSGGFCPLIKVSAGIVCSSCWC